MTNSDNVAAGLDPAILADAELMGGSAPGAPAPAAGPLIQSDDHWTDEAYSLWDCIGEMLSVYSPSCAPIYTEQAKRRLAAAWAPVMRKHDFDMGKFSIYLVAGMATLPIVAKTTQAIRADREATAAAAAADTTQQA